MKILQILAFLLATSPLFAQKQQLLELHINRTAARFSANYEYRLTKDPTAWINFYTRGGIGRFSSEETINTKIIKGTSFDPNSGVLLLDILAYFLFSTREKPSNGSSTSAQLPLM